MLVVVAAQVNGVPWCCAVHNLNHCAWQPVVTPTWCLNLASLSLSTLCLTGVSDRKTQKLDKDVPGWPSAGTVASWWLRQHSWDACAPFSSQGTCYANTQGPTHNGSRQPGWPARPPPPPPPYTIVLPSGEGQCGEHWEGDPGPVPFSKAGRGFWGGWECRGG